MTGSGWLIPSGYAVSSTGIGYVNPNAHCPVCGASVYFYQSPDGGRVFFESLGPPWPKHPCTDRGTAVKYSNIAQVELSTAIMERSAPAGWQAFACDAVSEIPHKKGTFELNGLVGDVRLKVFVQVSGLQVRAPYFVRTFDNDEYRISTFQLRNGTLSDFEFQGFKFLSQVVPLLEPASGRSKLKSMQKRIVRAKSPPRLSTPPERPSKGAKRAGKRIELKPVSLKDESFAVLQALRDQLSKKT